MSLVITFLVILAALILIGWILDRRHPPPTALEQQLLRLSQQFHEFSLTIGEELTPAMQQTADSFNAFAKALRKENQ